MTIHSITSVYSPPSYGNLPWDKVKFYHAHEFEASDITIGQSDASGKEYFHTRDESTYFQADAATTSCSIRMTSSNSKIVDYLVIGWHDLGTNEVTVSFQYKQTTSSIGYVDVLSDFTVYADNPIIKDFDSVLGVDFVLTLSYSSGLRPKIAMGYWGEKTELDWLAAAFDPNKKTIRHARHINSNGYLNAIKTRYVERSIEMVFQDIESSVYNDLVDWHKNVKNDPFFLAWDIATHPDDAFITRNPSGELNAPYKINGHRDLTLNLVGVAA